MIATYAIFYILKIKPWFLGLDIYVFLDVYVVWIYIKICISSQMCEKNDNFFIHVG
jgi:hypothetical protein